ncbi:UNVERIFIED_CONTAM: hypothetical protein FKN15_032794 [Acipenser sinensis]
MDVLDRSRERENMEQGVKRKEQSYAGYTESKVRGSGERRGSLCWLTHCKNGCQAVSYLSTNTLIMKTTSK